jgi:hypothetical protein
MMFVISWVLYWVLGIVSRSCTYETPFLLSFTYAVFYHTIQSISLLIPTNNLSETRCEAIEIYTKANARTTIVENVL